MSKINNQEEILPSDIDDILSVKIIDFAHSLPNNDGTNDEGYIFGITNLISYLSEIINDLKTTSNKSDIINQINSISEGYLHS